RRRRPPPPPPHGPGAPPPATSGGKASQSAARHRSRPRAALPTPGRRADACAHLPTRRPSAAAAATTARLAAVGQRLLLTSIVVTSVTSTTGNDAEPERSSAEHEHLKELLDLHSVSSGGEPKTDSPCLRETRHLGPRCGNQDTPDVGSTRLSPFSYFDCLEGGTGPLPRSRASARSLSSGGCRSALPPYRARRGPRRATAS